MLFFSSRKGAKPQRVFSLHLRVFVRSLLISLRLCAPYLFLSFVRFSFFDFSHAIFFFSQRRQAAKRFFFAPSRLYEPTLHFFASLRLCCLARSIAGRQKTSL